MAKLAKFQNKGIFQLQMSTQNTDQCNSPKRQEVEQMQLQLTHNHRSADDLKAMKFMSEGDAGAVQKHR